MSGDSIVSISDRRLKQLSARTDDQIDYSDIPELDDRFWSEARLIEPGEPKRQLTVRFDSDIVDWFKANGKGYQTRMNAVLRAYVNTKRKG